MTISGSGVGGNIGGMQQPTVTEQEQTSANEILKVGNGLAIVKDTLELAFYDVGGQITRYPANPSRPTLPPLISSRGPSGFEDNADTSWKQIVSTLVGILPPAVKNDYNEQMRLPAEQRNLNFVALDNALANAAIALAWLQGVSSPSSTEGIQTVQQALNEALPYIALLGMTSFAATVQTGATNFLDNAGANYPQQDALRNQARLMDKSLDKMEELQAKTTSNQALPTEEFTEFFAKTSLFVQQISRIYVGDDLSILGATLTAMRSLAGALAMSSTSSPSFIISLTLLAMGIEKTDSEAGIIGSNLAAATAALAAGIAELAIPSNSLAARQLLVLSCTAVLIGSVAFATLIGGNGLGYFPDRLEADIVSAQEFSTELALAIAVQSNVIGAVLSTIVETLGLSAVQQRITEAALNLFAMTLIAIVTAPDEDLEATTSPFRSLQSTIKNNLNIISESVQEGLLNQTLNGAAATTVAISLQQAKTALEAGNANDFMTALLGSLSAIGTTSEQFIGEISNMQAVIQEISQIIASSKNDNTNTETKISIVV